MRGDLHTLKKACAYGSKVMAVGTVVFVLIIAALVIMGAASLFSGDVSSFLLSLIGTDESESDSVKLFSFLLIVSIFILGLLTVVTVHRVMLSISSEHTPFTDGNTSTVHRLSKIYLAAAFVLAVFGALSSGSIASVLFLFFGCVLVAAVLFIFALMIRYGSVLQNEWDHTL